MCAALQEEVLETLTAFPQSNFMSVEYNKKKLGTIYKLLFIFLVIYFYCIVKKW